MEYQTSFSSPLGFLALKSDGQSITDISFSENELPPPNLPEVGNALGITLSVEGSYDQFRSFLASLEKNLRLIDVVGIDLGQGSEDAEIGFKVILRAYYQERTIL